GSAPTNAERYATKSTASTSLSPSLSPNSRWNWSNLSDAIWTPDRSWTLVALVCDSQLPSANEPPIVPGKVTVASGTPPTCAVAMVSGTVEPPPNGRTSNASGSRDTSALKRTVKLRTIERCAEPSLIRIAVTLGGIIQFSSLIETEAVLAEGRTVARSGQ